MNSQIGILIKRLCPNGVEKVKLGVLGSFENIGTDKKIVEGEQMVTLLNYVDVYHHKYIDASIPQMTVSASDKKIQDCTVERGDIFVTPTSETIDDIGHSSVITETIPNAVYSYHVMRFRQHNLNLVTSFYINYYFDSYDVKQQILKKAQGLTRFGLSKDKFASIEIPLPPLAIQQEIVKILDKFTSLIDKIDEEINLRQKQYEYYREKLLEAPSNSPRGEWEWKKLGDCCKSISSGKCAEKLEKGLYPVYGSTGIIAYTNNYVYGKEMVLIARVGANAGFVHIAKGKYDVTDNTLIIDLKENENLKFIYYTLINRGLNQYAKGGGQPLVTGRDIKELKFGFPSLSQQHTIVQTLDKFETLISQLKEERALRQKQYEYYREKLLSF